MKSVTGIILGVLAVILVIVGVLTYKNNDQTEDQALNSAGGSLYVGVTDATADIKNVNDIDLEVKKVEVQNSNGTWTTVSSDTKTYSLLALKANGKTEFYAKKDELAAGTYQKVRVTFGDATVRTKTEGNVKASMPSRQVVFNTNLKVNGGQNSHLKLDIFADKSLHMAKNNKYVFAVAAQAEARSNANVMVENGNEVMVSGGVVDRTSNFGMDLSGGTRADFTLSTDNTLQVDSPVGSTLNFMLGGKTYQSDNARVQENQWNTAGTSQLNANGTVNTSTDVNSSSSGSNSNTNVQGGVNIDLDGGVKLGN